MIFIKEKGKGILLCFFIGCIALFLGKKFPIIGGPVFAILIGMIVTLCIKEKQQFQAGITFTSKKVLQYAVILLGFGLNLSVIAKTGTITSDYFIHDYNIAGNCLCVEKKNEDF